MIIAVSVVKGEGIGRCSVVKTSGNVILYAMDVSGVAESGVYVSWRVGTGDGEVSVSTGISA